MFRHLSPKNANPIPKTTQQSNKYTGNTQPIPTNTAKKQDKTAGTTQTKDIKNLNTFFNKSPPHPPKKVNMPTQPLVKHTNSSTQNLRPVIQPKTGSTFDDYYEKRPKPMQFKKKQESSLSGDSYQSQGYMPVKHAYNAKTKSIDDNKAPFKSKNLVAVPTATQEQRSGFKPPQNLRLSKPLESDDAQKRMISFGNSNKRMGRMLSDENGKKIQISGDKKIPISPQPYNTNTNSNKLVLNMSDKEIKEKPTQFKLPTKDKGGKMMPNPQISNIKSSPFLAKKMSLNSSNQFSGEFPHKKDQKSKLEPLLSSLKKQKEDKGRDKKTQKSSSFNKGEKFLQLKKRQEHHTQLNKQLNTLGTKTELKILTTNEVQRTAQITLISKINQSKSTTIYLAHHPNTFSLFCLKKISAPELNSKQFTSIILQHKIHQYCKHPHIVKYFCTAVDASNIYEFMQYMEEGTLGHQLKKQILDNMSEQNEIKNKINESVTSQISKINKIRRILFEVGSALAYIHERNIIHRDIKPENIFISHDVYKLGDFGSASYNGSQQHVGTLDYAAPQILTQQKYNNKVDIWSMGCVAYELVAGRPPFFHINQEQTKKLAIQGQYDRSLICDSELASFIQHCLQPFPEKRSTASQLLNHQFLSSLKSQIFPI